LWILFENPRMKISLEHALPEAEAVELLLFSVELARNRLSKL
jgi:hypothetical protein